MMNASIMKGDVSEKGKRDFIRKKSEYHLMVFTPYNLVHDIANIISVIVRFIKNNCLSLLKDGFNAFDSWEISEAHLDQHFLEKGKNVTSIEDFVT